jgi:hypothetical protein
MSLAGELFGFWVARAGKSPQFLLDCSSRFDPKSHELYPDPYTREAIAYFATSLDFDVRPRQEKSEIYDGAFRKMCRSINEQSMRAEVWRAKSVLCPSAFINHMEFL